jgi:hypothetical protein
MRLPFLSRGRLQVYLFCSIIREVDRDRQRRQLESELWAQSALVDACARRAITAHDPRVNWCGLMWLWVSWGPRLRPARPSPTSDGRRVPAFSRFSRPVFSLSCRLCRTWTGDPFPQIPQNNLRDISQPDQQFGKTLRETVLGAEAQRWGATRESKCAEIRVPHRRPP